MSIAEIENLTRKYADTRKELSSKVDSLQEEIDRLKKQKLPGIRTALARAVEAEAKLKTAIDINPALFIKPRTQIFHGIKVGFQKGKGIINWKNAEAVVKLIRRHFADRVDELTRTKVEPDKTALNKLSAEDLKKIGVTVKEAGDEVFIKPVDGEVEKIVNALLKGATEEEQAA